MAAQGPDRSVLRFRRRAHQTWGFVWERHSSRREVLFDKRREKGPEGRHELTCACLLLGAGWQSVTKKILGGSRGASFSSSPARLLVHGGAGRTGECTIAG